MMKKNIIIIFMAFLTVFCLMSIHHFIDYQDAGYSMAHNAINAIETTFGIFFIPIVLQIIPVAPAIFVIALLTIIVACGIVPYIIFRTDKNFSTITKYIAMTLIFLVWYGTNYFAWQAIASA